MRGMYVHFLWDIGEIDDFYFFRMLKKAERIFFEGGIRTSVGGVSSFGLITSRFLGRYSSYW